jgi:polyhydroxybutyrate depolymerase
MTSLSQREVAVRYATSTLALSALFLAACSNSTSLGKADAASSEPPPSSGVTCSGKAKPGAADSTFDGGIGYYNVQVPGQDGGVREAIVHVPASYDPTKGTMLVVNMHGLLGNDVQEANYTKMSEVADQKNFIVVYPQGLSGSLGTSWNAGVCCLNTNDDVGFIRHLVTKLESDYCIDPKKVFATGLSNGAMMSYRLACEASDVFAAVAPVSGSVEVGTCAPPRPVPVLAFHGTSDSIVPYYGGTDGIVHVLPIPSVAKSINQFKTIDACPDANDTSTDVDASFVDSKTVYQKGDATCRSWSPCAAESEVELCTITGGGHAWPGSGASFGAGIASNDIDASSYIIDFFLKHPMP